MGALRHALSVLLARRDALTQVIDQLRPLAEAESPQTPPAPPAPMRSGPRKAKTGRKKKAAKATRRAKGTRAPKAPASAAGPTSLPDAPREGATGRPPSPASAACRSAVLLQLLAASTVQSFVEIKDAIAGVMKKNGVADDEALTQVLQRTQTALRTKGLIERSAGAWRLTDAGRAEALRIRAAVKNAA